MSLLKIVTFTVAIILGCCCYVSHQEENCLKTCEKEILEAEKTGDYPHCKEWMSEQNGKLYDPLTKCEVDCRGIQAQVAENTNDCLCNHCKSSKWIAENFCTAPGAGPLKVQDCDAMVCTGKAKLLGYDKCAGEQKK